MDITFDINKDELPIFLSEVDEHLETLDNHLLHLQKADADTELIQTLFRSAHTIKGMAGMIGHRRMTDVTHALESALDDVRKNSIQISMPLINLCLKAVDCLRLLREEVATSMVSEVDIEGVVAALKRMVASGQKEAPPNTVLAANQNTAVSGDALQIHAKIDTNSMASAARAFQLMMALQDLGQIQAMSPSQQEIEGASSVAELVATLITDQPVEKISMVLTKISGVDEISINGKLVIANGTPVEEQVETRRKNAQLRAQAEAMPGQQSRERRGTQPSGRRISDLTLRMSIERMDNLMNLVGELITDRNHVQQLRSQIAAETSMTGNLDQLFETLTHLGRITDQLQEEVMGIRMLPIGSIFNKFPRMVHDMSQKVGKSVNLVVHGEDTEMDRSMIDTIYDPLIHLIRNSVDHGIESPAGRVAAGKREAGTVTLTARHEQGRIVVIVEDDGRGIDPEKLRNKALQKGLISAEEAAALTAEQSINLMFLAGLSTAEVATELSGRGVGLDIVKTNIQRVNGSIQVESHIGIGTKFQITLPLTLAIIPSLLVKVGQSVFAVPMVMITEMVRLENSDVHFVNRKPVVLLRGQVLALHELSELFHISTSGEERKQFFAVVIQSGKQKIGLVADSLIGEEEVVVKPLGEFIGDIPGISSATILGNGQVALIVDMFSLFKQVEIQEKIRV